MFSLQSCSAGVPSLATTKPFKETGVMPWSKQDVLQSYRLVCVLIALLLTLISSHFAGSIPISPLCLTTVPSLLHSVHGKHSISSEPYHVSVEALSYTCDSDLVIAILFIILHYHKYSRCHHGTEMKITLKTSVHCLQREGSWAFTLVKMNPPRVTNLSWERAITFFTGLEFRSLWTHCQIVCLIAMLNQTD